MNIILGRHDISRMVQLPLEKKRECTKAFLTTVQPCYQQEQPTRHGSIKEIYYAQASHHGQKTLQIYRRNEKNERPCGPPATTSIPLPFITFQSLEGPIYTVPACNYEPSYHSFMLTWTKVGTIQHCGRDTHLAIKDNYSTCQYQRLLPVSFARAVDF